MLLSLETWIAPFLVYSNTLLQVVCYYTCIVCISILLGLFSVDFCTYCKLYLTLPLLLQICKRLVASLLLLTLFKQNVKKKQIRYINNSKGNHMDHVCAQR